MNKKGVKNLNDIDMFDKDDFDIDDDEDKKIVVQKTGPGIKPSAEKEPKVQENGSNVNGAKEDTSKKMNEEQPPTLEMKEPAPVAKDAPLKSTVDKDIKLKYVQSVGNAPPVDEYVPNKEKYQVHNSGSTYYSKTLSSTDSRKNANKFYIIQVLSQGNKFYVLKRWGRIGVPGTKDLSEYRNAAAAIAEFNKTFNKKAHGGSYTEVKQAYGKKESDDEEDEDENLENDSKDAKTPKSVSEVIKLIFSLKIFNQSIKEIGYDARQMPLGMLSPEAVKEGLAVLKKIEAEIKKFSPEAEKSNNRRTKKPTSADVAKLGDLTSLYFRKIPHNVGMNLSAHIIRTEEKLQEETELAQMLLNFKHSRKEKAGKGQNKIDFHYKSLNVVMSPLPKAGEEFKFVENSALSTVPQIHKGLNIRVTNIFSLNKGTENASFKKDIPNRHLLWYGSRMTNYSNLLKQGLEMPAPEAPQFGFCFGKGLYFFDTFSKAILQCFGHLSDGDCFVLGCEVALGESVERLQSNYNGVELEENQKSVKGCGRMAPKDFAAIPGVENSPLAPVGPIDASGKGQSTFQFNEYAVFDPSQVKMKYLIKCKMGNK